MKIIKKKIFVASNISIEYFFYLCKVLNFSGFEVKKVYLMSESNYRFLSRKNFILKLWLRICMYLIYPFYLILRGLTAEKGSIFIISSNTFFAPFLTQSILKFKNLKVIHLLYDLYPEALEASSIIKKNSLLSKIIGQITTKNQKVCSGTVYLGELLRHHAELRWGKPNLSTVIDISTDLSLYSCRETNINELDKIVIHYGGQLGESHDALAIVKCVQEIYDSELSKFINFSFYVSGSKANYLRKELKEYPIKINHTINSYEWRKKTKDFHIGLVTLMPYSSTVCLPSKTYGMMASGLAILSISPVWSDLSQLITQHNAGWVINNSPYEFAPKFSLNKNYFQGLSEYRDINLIVKDFKNIMQEIVLNKDILRTKMNNSFQGIRENYNINKLNKKWGEFLSNYY